VCLTAEPSGNAIGTLIRHGFLHGKKASPEIEALLFAADRALHLESEVRPALAAGKVVVCDRYMYASFAYQGAQGVDLNWLREINRFADAPHLAIYLDVPAETALARIRRKRSVLERLELQRRVREEYLKLVKAGELVLVDSSKPLAEVSREICALATRRLRELGL
jgi:dTMP kinase